MPSASTRSIEFVSEPEALLNQTIAFIKQANGFFFDLLLEVGDLRGQRIDVGLCLVPVVSPPDVAGQPRGAAPFLPAAASRPVLDAFEEMGLGDVIEDVGRGYQGGGG